MKKIIDKYKKEIVELIKEARNSDIIINPPSLLNLCSDYSIFNDEICYGLSNVLGIGKAESAKFIEGIRDFEQEFRKPKEEWTWFDFLKFSDNTTTTVIQHLISVGFLRHLKIYRKQLLRDYNVWRRLRDNEKQYLKDKDFQTLIIALKMVIEYLQNKKETSFTLKRIKLINDEITSLIDSPTSIKDTLTEINEKESMLLHYPLTCSTLSSRNMIERSPCILLQTLAKYKDLVVNATIDTVNEYTIKRGQNRGRKMGRLSIEDDSAEIENIVVFSDEWENFKHTLFEGNTVELYITMRKSGLIVKGAKQI